MRKLVLIVVLMMSAGAVLLLGQKVWREYPAFEYNDFPIPADYQEKTEFSYSFLNCFVEGVPPPEGRWSQGPSLDGRGEFSLADAQPLGEEPVLAPPAPDSGAQVEQFAAPSGKRPRA